MTRAITCAALLALAACASWDARLKLPLRTSASDMISGETGYVSEPFEPGTDGTELAALALLEAMDQGATTVHSVSVQVRVGDFVCSEGLGGGSGPRPTARGSEALIAPTEVTIERRITWDCETSSRFVETGHTTRTVLSLLATRVRQKQDLGKPKRRECDPATLRRRVSVPRFLQEVDFVPFDWSLIEFRGPQRLIDYPPSCVRKPARDEPPYVVVVGYESGR